MKKYLTFHYNVSSFTFVTVTVIIRPRKKNCFRLTGCQKKISAGLNITIKDGWTIDIVKILLLWNVLSVYKNVFESSLGGMFKPVNPKHEHRTKPESGRLSESQLSWLQSRNVYTLVRRIIVSIRVSA